MDFGNQIAEPIAYYWYARVLWVRVEVVEIQRIYIPFEISMAQVIYAEIARSFASCRFGGY